MKMKCYDKETNPLADPCLLTIVKSEKEMSLRKFLFSLEVKPACLPCSLARNAPASVWGSRV
jgi:hypothetical protein